MPLADAKFLNNEEYPVSIRLSGLTGKSLSPAEYKQLLDILVGPEPTSTSTEGMIAPPAAGGAGDPEYDRKQYESYKNYILGKLKEKGITEAQPSPSDPEVNIQPNTPQQPSSTLPLPQEKVVVDIEVGDQPATPVEQNNEVQKTPQLTEEEQYQKDKNALLEKAKENQPALPQEENLEEKIMPAPSPVEVTPAPGFENLVNQQRREQAVEENRLTTSSPTVEQKAQTTQEAFQGLVNDARSTDTQVAGAPALAIPLGLGVGAAVLTGVGVKEGGQALQGLSDNVQTLLEGNANVPDSNSQGNPVGNWLQENAPTVMGIFGLGGNKSTPKGKPQATYGEAGLSPEEKAKRQKLKDFRENYEKTFGPGSLDRPPTQRQPGKGRGMGDTWEGPQSSVTPGKRSEKLASTSSFTEPTRTTGSRSEKLASASSSDSSQTKGSRSDVFGAMVNSSREAKLKGFA